MREGLRGRLGVTKVFRFESAGPAHPGDENQFVLDRDHSQWSLWVGSEIPNREFGPPLQVRALFLLPLLSLP